MKNVAYESKIKAMGWPELATLFSDIKARKAIAGWAAGKPLEYLVPRMFELRRRDSSLAV